MLDKLPKDVLISILFKLKPHDRIGIVRANKQLRSIADSEELWKKECAYQKLDTTSDEAKKTTAKEIYKQFKDIYVTDTKLVYFIVGNNIRTSEPIWSGTRDRKNIPEKEIINSFPKETSNIAVFITQEEAKKFATSREVSEHGTVDESPAIFKVQLKDKIQVKTKILNVQVMGDIGRFFRGLVTKPIRHFTVDREQIEHSFCAQLQDRKEIYFDINKEKDKKVCRIM